MPAEDAATTRLVRREIVRRRIDDTMLQVNSMHGVVYIRGEVRSLRGENCDLEAEMNIIHRILRSRPGIRDVIIEVNHRR
ncbi:MAG: hypothetical protein ACUVSM_06370 [Armatimonadota bacterium]